MEDCLQFLKDEIEGLSTLSEIIDVFRHMCGAFPKDDDLLLFPYGRPLPLLTWVCRRLMPSFFTNAETLIPFSLIRQVSSGDGEYDQLCVDVLYRPTRKTKLPYRAFLCDGIRGDFFDRVLRTRAYARLKDTPIERIDVYLSGT